jgi:hypothetical protein
MTKAFHLFTNIPAGGPLPEPLRVLHAQKARQKACAPALNFKPAPTQGCAA